MSTLIPYVEIILGVILVALILLQKSSSGAGSALGGGDNFSSAFHTRRGLEKHLFRATIVVAVLFAIFSFIAVLV